MITAPIGSLEAGRRILAFCVLSGITVRVVAFVPAGPPKIALQPGGALPPLLREMLALPLVRQVVARHLELGAARFCQPSSDAHSHNATAAGLAHLTLCLLTAEQRDAFEERAAIREHDGGLRRARAELLALLDLATHASAIEAITALTTA